jgi:acetylornithine deacetylase/succinyl-diaminopimelate desuccinylase-like protein
MVEAARPWPPPVRCACPASSSEEVPVLEAETQVTGEVTELLQDLIRNRCVNDGTPESGEEVRNVDALASYLDGSGLDLQRYEALPRRANLVARIDGSDPTAASLMLMGHTDVVPVNPAGWRHDPFGGELIEGEVWGRGAVDMLNLTASMAVAIRRLALEGFRPRGTLIYLAVADEEALGTHGAKWLVDREPDAVEADFVVTEFGGVRMPLPSTTGLKLPVIVAEKGSYWCTLTVRGTPGHASMPFRTDNALVKAAEVVRRIADHRPDPRLHETWRRFVGSVDLPEELRVALLDPGGIDVVTSSFPDAGLARMIHACTHTTYAPTVMHAGVKTNVIPDEVRLQIDIRTLPGETSEETRASLQDILGDLAPSVEIAADSNDEASASPVDTRLWSSLQQATEALVPGATNVPFMSVGATDARFFRRWGKVAYGAGLFSDRMSFTDFASMFHGDNERVDQESLRLSTELWAGLCRDLLG